MHALMAGFMLIPHMLFLTQVLEKAAQVKQLRAEVPALVSQSVQGELEGLRPLIASVEHLTAQNARDGACCCYACVWMQKNWAILAAVWGGKVTSCQGMRMQDKSAALASSTIALYGCGCSLNMQCLSRTDYGSERKGS